MLINPLVCLKVFSYSLDKYIHILVNIILSSLRDLQMHIYVRHCNYANFEFPSIRRYCAQQVAPVGTAPNHLVEGTLYPGPRACYAQLELAMTK